MSTYRVTQESSDTLAEYARIPIGFTATSRLRLPELIRSGGTEFVEEPTPPTFKDYDLVPSEHPASLPSRFNLSNWGILGAHDGSERLGGAILAFQTPEFEMLQGRSDLCVLVDLRVQPTHRGKGIGRLLFEAAVDWAQARACRELNVETQDTNPDACRFYAAMGCRLASADIDGYGPDIAEAKLIWRIQI